MRIAVDIGGTFTDILHIDESSMRITADKVRSTPYDIGRAVMDAIKKTHVDLSDVALFIHGTTVGLNTIAQRKGAKVGLITTKGFIDVLEMGGKGREKEIYNYLWKKPKPLVPRYLRRGVTERTNAWGEIVEALDDNEVKRIVDDFRNEGVEAVAVCLLHSYINLEHEQRVAEIITRVWPDVSVSLSHWVARQFGEYERMSTTVISAYMGKAIKGYLDRLDANLKDTGFMGQLLLLGPSGVLGIEAVKEDAIFTLASGPIGGAAGSAYLAGLYGLKDVVTMDVGGTSFDVSLIKDGVNLEKHQTELMGYPVLMAGIDIRPIGAGGGSVARVDEAGLLSVGPDSAGADPGPMSYGLGGTEPTVTDAALVNGILDSEYFLGGESCLHMDLAEKGIKEIADRLGLDLHRTADGILSIARNNMITATNEILIRHGLDPRDFAIMAYGGGGGIFATGLARDMSIKRVIIPPRPGVYCAWGILTMDLVHRYAQSHIGTLADLDIKELEGIYKSMENNALHALTAEGISRDSMEYVRTLDIAYAGQAFYFDTPVPDGELKGEDKEIIRRSFIRLHENRYGHRVEAPLVTMNARLKAVGKIKEMPMIELGHGKEIPDAAIKPRRRVYLDEGFFETRIYERQGLLCGNRIEGPAIVEEPFHTAVVMPGQMLEVDKFGSLVIYCLGDSTT